MSELIHSIREFFWPLLEGEAKHYQIDITALVDSLEEETDKGKIDELLGLSKLIHDREEKRRRTVEAKATTLLGATGLTTTLIVGFGKTPLFQYDGLGTLTSFVFVGFFIITLLYFWRTITYSLRALRRSGYETMLPHEIIEMKGTDEFSYKKKMAMLILAKTATNYRPTNEKVDWMVMSQEYFRRGIHTIIIGMIVISLSVILHWAWLQTPNHPVLRPARQKSVINETQSGDVNCGKRDVDDPSI
jgi:hypothetical protein